MSLLFPIGILGQVWYLIVSIPDLCTLTYFDGLSMTCFGTPKTGFLAMGPFIIKLSIQPCCYLVTGVSVVNTDIKEHIQSNFTVIMTNGIGFQVVELMRSNVLQLDLMIPADKFVSTSKHSYITHTVQLHCDHATSSRYTK